MILKIILALNLRIPPISCELNGLLTKLSERNKKFTKTYTKTGESIGGLEKVAKGEPRENPPEACDKSPESC